MSPEQKNAAADRVRRPHSQGTRDVHGTADEGESVRPRPFLRLSDYASAVLSRRREAWSKRMKAMNDVFLTIDSVHISHKMATQTLREVGQQLTGAC